MSNAHAELVAMARSTPSTKVICSQCGDGFELSRRNELEHLRHGVLIRCYECKHPRTPSPAVLAAMKTWWLSRFSLDELKGWPPLP